MNFVCAVCNSDKNLYRSKYCVNKHYPVPKEHYFCWFCCFKLSRKINADTLDWGSKHRIICPFKHCHSLLFEIEHYQSGVKRSINELLMELHCFRLSYKKPSLVNVMKTIEGTLRGEMEDFLAHNFTGQSKAFFDLMLSVKRIFDTRPNTYDECQKSVTFELEWYDWNSYPKCESCYTEVNLHQCVNKSECQHLCCLKCFLETLNDEHHGNVICPLCQSYCAGTLERYQCKTQFPREVSMLIWRAATKSDTVEAALGKLDEWSIERRPWKISAEKKLWLVQAKDRLTKQPECFLIFKNLHKFELPYYDYNLTENVNI